MASAQVMTGAAGTAVAEEGDGNYGACGCDDAGSTGIMQSVGNIGAIGAVGAVAVVSAAEAVQAGAFVKDTVVDHRVVIEEIEPVHHRKRRRWLWLLLPLVLLLMLLFTGVVFASSTATVTLTLEQRTFSGTAVVYQHPQTLYAGVSLSQTILPSRAYIPGTPAYGTLTFSNASTKCGCAVIVPAGTVFKASHGVRVITDAAAILGPHCTVTVPAHSLVLGVIGDIPAHFVHTIYMRTITVDNGSAFRGALNGYWTPWVYQQSIDQAAHALAARAHQQALAALKAQGQKNGLVFLSITCNPLVFSNRQAGAYAMGVHIGYGTSCTGQAYDPNAALSQAKQALMQQAQAFFGQDYASAHFGKITFTRIVDQNNNTVLLVASMQGQWSYQLSQAQEQEITQIIAGKLVSDAEAFLLNQRGITGVTINPSRSVMGMLPLLSKNITINVQH